MLTLILNVGCFCQEKFTHRSFITYRLRVFCLVGIINPVCLIHGFSKKVIFSNVLNKQCVNSYLLHPNLRWLHTCPHGLNSFSNNSSSNYPRIYSILYKNIKCEYKSLTNLSTMFTYIYFYLVDVNQLYFHRIYSKNTDESLDECRRVQTNVDDSQINGDECR